MKNTYIKNAKISEVKFRRILRLFCLDLEARQATQLLHLNRAKINRIYHKIRERIALLCEAESPFENGEVKLDKSFFGARRVHGKRGR